MFESNFDKWGNQLRSNEILEYDENNNWIRRYQIINNHKLLLNERKIEYYLD